MADVSNDFGTLFRVWGLLGRRGQGGESLVVPSLWRIEAPARARRRRHSASRRHRLTGPVFYPNSWPRQMSADIAAAYCGEVAVEDFLKLVGILYPPPHRAEGRRRFWLKDDLDEALTAIGGQRDAADDF